MQSGKCYELFKLAQHPNHTMHLRKCSFIYHTQGKMCMYIVRCSFVFGGSFFFVVFFCVHRATKRRTTRMTARWIFIWMSQFVYSIRMCILLLLCMVRFLFWIKIKRFLHTVTGTRATKRPRPSWDVFVYGRFRKSPSPIPHRSRFSFQLCNASVCVRARERLFRNMKSLRIK